MISNHLGQIFLNFQNFVPKVRSRGRGFKCINVSSSRHFGIAALVPLEMWYIFAQVEFTAGAVDCF